MGACASSQVREDNQDNGTWLWCLPLRKEAREASEPRISNSVDPNASSCQPQRRPEMEIAKIQTDRNLNAANSGQWLASPVVQHHYEVWRRSQTNVGELVASSKRRKRSLSVALHRVSHRRRRTAPERQRPEWRISLRSFGTRSPFPDFTCYALPEVPEEDTRSSVTCVEGLSTAYPEPSRPWPLPDKTTVDRVNASDNPSVRDDGLGRSRSNSSPTRSNAVNDHTQQRSQRHRLHSRVRALSDPFRYGKRKQTSTKHDETGNVNAEIHELRVLVAARKKQTLSDDDANVNAFSSADAVPTSSHQRGLGSRTTLARTKSRGHIPAIAPNMKMRVRSQVLSDIGSAFSRPLNTSSGNSNSGSSDAAIDACPLTPTPSECAVDDVDAVSNVSPLPASSSIGVAITNGAPSKREHGSGYTGIFHSSSASSVTCTSTLTASASQRTSAATTVSVALMERSKLAERRSGSASAVASGW